MNRETLLFRPEAEKKGGDFSLGAANLAAPIRFSYWALFAAAVIVAIILLMVFGKYTRHESLSGQLVSRSGILTLSVETPGILTHMFIGEGDSVSKGQPLLEVSSDRESVVLGAARAQRSAELLAQKTHIGHRISNLRTQMLVRQKDMQVRIRMLHAQLNASKEQLDLERRLAAASAKRLEKVEPIMQLGIMSAIQLEQYRVNALSDQIQVKAMDRQILDAEQQLSQLTSELARLPIDSASLTSELEAQLSQLDAQLAENEASRKFVLRASQSGRVTNFLAMNGQNLVPGQPLLSILPHGSELEAQLLVPSRAIGLIKVGNPVILRYQAFPYQKFGVQYGQVRQISDSALDQSQARSLLGRETAESFYRVLVSLPQQTMSVDGKNETLRPGMAVDADVQLEQRPLWQWAFAPLYGLTELHKVPAR